MCVSIELFRFEKREPTHLNPVRKGEQPPCSSLRILDSSSRDDSESNSPRERVRVEVRSPVAREVADEEKEGETESERLEEMKRRGEDGLVWRIRRSAAPVLVDGVSVVVVEVGRELIL